MGGEGDALGDILFPGGIAQCVCVCVCVGGGGGGPDQVYGVIYGLDIVNFKFTRPLGSFFFLLTITPEERDEAESSVCCVFRKQCFCCHGQHDDCGGIGRDHLVSDVTDLLIPPAPPPPPPPPTHTHTDTLLWLSPPDSWCSSILYSELKFRVKLLVLVG